MDRLISCFRGLGTKVSQHRAGRQDGKGSAKEHKHKRSPSSVSSDFSTMARAAGPKTWFTRSVHTQSTRRRSSARPSHASVPPTPTAAPSTVDCSLVPDSFTTFAVCLHADNAAVELASQAARQRCREQGIQGFDKRSHSAGPYGNFFALTWPEGRKERVAMCAEIIECLWIYDDRVEAVPHSEAMEEHARVMDVLDGEMGGKASRKSALANIFRDFGRQLAAMDPVGGPRMIAGLKQYMTEYDGSGVNYQTIAEYVKFRGLNVGFGIMEHSMQWALDLWVPSDMRQLPLFQEYLATAAPVMALTNDFYSWETERDEPTDRPRNAVPIIMAQYGISEAEAKVFLKGMIVDAEQTTKRLGLRLKTEARRVVVGEKAGLGGWDAQRVDAYVEAMALMLGGNCFWSATCPRYNPGKEFPALP